MVFVNRTRELAGLDQWWNQPGPLLGVVWGRRRVGKSWLLRHWGNSRRTIFHIGRTRPLEQEFRTLSTVAAPALNLRRRDLAERPFTDWDDLFDTLATAAETEPLLLVLDEFPDLLKTTPDLESHLRSIWERLADTKLRLILCGSSVRTMEALQAERAPLFGRATLRMQVNPFTPHETAKMLPGLDPTERAKAWGVCGGMPFYLRAWDPTHTFRHNIARLFCHDQALLLNEGELVLATEDVAGGRRERLPEQVLRAIASGRTSHKDIQASINALPDRTLEALVALRLIRRVIPVTERPTSRLSYYQIADNFLAFWLTVIERHRAAIEQGQGPSVVDVIVESFDDYMGSRWEEAFRAHLVHTTATGAVLPDHDVVAVGEYWRRRTGPNQDPCQLDALALTGRSRTAALIGEAKWTKRIRGDRIVHDMQRKVDEAQLNTIPNPVYAVCARSQVDRPPDNTLTVTATDIFG